MSQNNVRMDRISPFARLRHIAVAVKDMDRAVAFYSSLGVGPFITPPQRVHHVSDYVSKLVKNQPMGPVELIVREAKIGPVVLQLVQVVSGDCVYTEFLRSKGEGVQHLGFVVDDIDKAEEQALQLGLKIVQRGRRGDGSGNTYFDTEAQAGVTLEIRDGND